MMPTLLSPLLATSNQLDAALATTVPKESIPRTDSARGSCDHRIIRLRSYGTGEQTVEEEAPHTHHCDIITSEAIIISYCFNEPWDVISIFSGHDIDQRFASCKSLHLLADQLESALHKPVAVAGHMRRNQQIRRLPQGMT